MTVTEHSTETTASHGGGRLRRGVYVAPFDELADPHHLLELAVAAEEHGWDGFFVWDHIVWGAPVRAIAGPWVVLSAIAAHTERLRSGPLVTPLARRRVQKVARETATLDQLSRGRLVLGIGLGGIGAAEFERFEEIVDPRERAQRLDSGLEALSAFWHGEFEPASVQKPRIPIWVASRWPNRRPLRRAARLNGIFPIEPPDPDALAELTAALAELGGRDPRPFDIAIDRKPGADTDPWRDAGATWILTDFGPRPKTAASATSSNTARNEYAGADQLR